MWIQRTIDGQSRCSDTPGKVALVPIQPFIFVGVGGTGGQTLGVIRKTLSDALSRIGWEEEWPDGWQFVHIDVPADPDADAADAAYALPRTSYVPLTTARSTYQGFHDAITQELTHSGLDAAGQYHAWGSWRPEPPSAVKVEIPNGAGQYRGIGRACVLKSLKLVDQALTRAYDASTAAETAPQLRRVQEQIGHDKPTAGDVRPVIFVIGSVSGGSGSGMLLDVVDVLRGHGHREVNAVVFTPEVFEKPTGETEPGVAPNTFMALSEVSNSMWTHAQADAPLSRDRMFSRAGVSYPVGHGGPSTIFLVGRRNRSVTFDSADDVYKIVGRSLGELALDEKLTTAVVNYDIANGNAVAAGSKDSLNLSTPDANRDVAPFRGLGFSRLSVGRDFFDRYASDRLLRRAALRLLDGHLERRRAQDPSSDDELKQQMVQEAWPAFLRDVKLDEVREKNAISERLDAWNEPEMAPARADFANLVREDITAGPRRGKVQNAEARANVVVRVKSARGANTSIASAIQKATSRRALELQDEVQQTLEQVILRNVAAFGLPVTIDLMDRLIDRSREGVESLAADRTYVGNKIDDVLGALPTPPAGAPAEFPVGSVDDVESILSEAQDVLRKHVQMIALEVSQSFLDDLTANLLEPWRRALSDADGLLRLELRPAVGRSPLDTWPGDDGVPDYLRPSKVEFLLDDVDTFPEQFVSVIERSVSGDKGIAAIITATEQVIAGEELGIHARTRPVALIEQRWVPTLELARRKGQNRAAAQVSITLGLSDLKARTHEWLVDQEKYVGQHLKQSLGDYLTDPLTAAAERKTRQSRLVGHFESMVKASLPLVALESEMTNLIHGHDVPPYNLHVSTLNVPSQLDDVRQQIKDTAVALLNTPQIVKFSNAPRQDAMMMTLLSEPYHLVEVASIMSPISKQWSKGGRGRDVWQYRRARPLSEWVPLGPDARRALVSGWFAARLLGTANVEGEGGTELTVNVSGKTRKIPKAGVRLPTRRDHVGMLLEALPTAFLECYNQKSLTGIEAYQYLISLGASLDKEENPVTAWLAGGKAAGAPEIAPAIADGVSRKDAAAMLTAKWRETYDAFLGKEAPAAEAQVHPTLEVADDVREALTRIQEVIDRQIEQILSDVRESGPGF